MMTEKGKSVKAANRSMRAKEAINQTDKKQKQKSKVKNLHFGHHLFKVLRQVHPDIGISSKSMSIMENFTMDIFEKIGKEAANITHKQNTRTITSRDIQTSVRLVIPGELVKHAVTEGTKAVTKYLNAKPKK